MRGANMIVAMKVISLSFDADAASKGNDMQNICELLGYVLCPANCVLGPWVAFGEYLTLYRNRKWVSLFINMSLLII